MKFVRRIYSNNMICSNFEDQKKECAEIQDDEGGEGFGQRVGICRNLLSESWQGYDRTAQWPV